MNGWRSWTDPAPVRPAEPEHAPARMYCPRCDTETAWIRDGDVMLHCHRCRLTELSPLTDEELARAMRRYEQVPA